jgi:hypothetical protein
VRLTAGSVLQVVVDPRNADAVLTDHLGQSFEEQLDVMYGAKPKDDKNGSTSEFARVTSGARSRGAIFLVNRKTRDVLWSTYERPKGPAPADLNRAADRIGDKLAKAIKGK